MDAETPFAKGDFRNIVPRFAPEARQANKVFVDLLQEIAAAQNATPAQVALAWLLSRKRWIVPIPGTTKLYSLEENLAAVELVLDPDELQHIDDALLRLKVQGERYPAQFAARAGRSRHNLGSASAPSDAVDHMGDETKETEMPHRRNSPAVFAR